MGEGYMGWEAGMEGGVAGRSRAFTHLESLTRCSTCEDRSNEARREALGRTEVREVRTLVT